MEPLVIVVLAVFGAIIASFAGVIAARLYTGQSFLVGRSRCDACAAPIPALALVPLISFLFHKGRAGCCGARISPVSPISEVVLALLFVLAYLRLGMTPQLPLMLVSLALLLALVLYDLAHQILPSSLLYTFVVVSTLSGFFNAPSGAAFIDSVVVALALASSLAAIHFFSRGRAMGLADAPLTFGLALLVGPAALSGFIYSFWIGAVVGIGLLLGRPKGSRMGVEVPFAPFLACGFLLAYFTQWNLFALAASLPIVGF